MNINEVLTQVLKKDERILEQILHLNDDDELEEKPERALEIIAREARNREMSEKADELKKIEKEIEDRKLELERLRLVARMLEKANRLMKAEEEIAQLKRALADKEDNRQLEGNKILTRSSEKKCFGHELGDEEEDEEWELQKFEVRLSAVKSSRNIFWTILA